MNNYLNTTGILKITVLSGIFLYPVEGALVTVIAEDGEASDVAANVYTGNGGTTGPIVLDAYDENYNVPTDPIRPVKRYTVRVSKDGYSTVIQQGIPVFPGIVSEKFVYMIPLPEKNSVSYSQFDETIYDNETSGSMGGMKN